MGQLAIAMNTLQQRRCPSNIVSNHCRDEKVECKVISLRSGKELLEIQQPTIKPSGSNSEETLEGLVGNDKEFIQKYAKYLKEMLSKKKHFTEFATVVLTKEITSVIKPNSPLNCKDPSFFTIPCVIGMANPTTVTLKLVDQSFSDPYEDQEIPLIVGRPLLVIANALVDVESGEIIVRLGDEFKDDHSTCGYKVLFVHSFLPQNLKYHGWY
ncbi:hypothetical protein K1719_004541 [Acacia pycnantha]|nr:hypothetical protein K1719_004541 [Acacia pycnantha]